MLVSIVFGFQKATIDTENACKVFLILNLDQMETKRGRANLRRLGKGFGVRIILEIKFPA